MPQAGEEAHGHVDVVTYTADGAVTKGEPVTLSGADTVTSPAAGGFIEGVAFTDADDGETLPVAIRGEIWVASAGAAAGDFVEPDGSGAVAAAAAGDEQRNAAQAKTGTSDGVAKVGLR